MRMEIEYEKQTIAPELLFAAVAEELAAGRRASFTVTGMSMWPFLCHLRDQVVVEKCDPAALRVGDIVLFQTPLGNYMLHRIIALRPDAFMTAGDGNCFRDGWFSPGCVKAKAVTVIRKGKAIGCGSAGWRFASGLWRALSPIRPLLLRLGRRMGNQKARIRKWLKKHKQD